MNFTDAFYDRKITCPLCSQGYTTKKVLSKAIKALHVEGDFYATYSIVNPNYYAINVCPDCGYAFLDKTKPKITSYKRELYRQQVGSRWVSREYGGMRSIEQALVSFKLALFCAQFMGEPERTIGGLCLQVAWLYREMDDLAQEQRFLREALHFYTHAYEYDRMIDTDGRIIYLLGELHRRLSEQKEAVKYFQQVISDKQALPKYVKLARTQWALMREKQQVTS
ncbi:hypothetical protein CIG75_07390 [Tumebacillus algifaecis]|uniref:DUF2225 domain-containing protein n=1 Tax=Tumebacillus algifaecis TaxID=1214604 RepID=A0A223CZD1_9BACL|nr:DUF2225 domain-containing protein [Tumebacillus algifaecis]ASS74819.1 hypothetical protein CIG75_07390 [Tumebacillus algifaecis]